LTATPRATLPLALAVSDARFTLGLVTFQPVPRETPVHAITIWNLPPAGAEGLVAELLGKLAKSCRVTVTREDMFSTAQLEFKSLDAARRALHAIEPRCPEGVNAHLTGPGELGS
jgi:hypothetical protein